ncbi:methyl-accepting chemotaxis protein [Kordiimonas pumila]|uniref:Methyl-accepting chemotaxis protein n=1 Tax=Kordiimonas pumila TaxID=2161677 RepID=A0ABV7D204_9PROT|nr:HAMP domain-containing methyl-accepting chemotaxis protein [Kordiimonas pumila]
MSVRLRIIFGFLAIIAILGGVNITSALKLRSLTSSSDQIVKKTEVVRLVNNYTTSVLAQAHSLRSFAYSGLDLDKQQVELSRENASLLKDQVVEVLIASENKDQADKLTVADAKFDEVFTRIENRLGNDSDALQVVLVGIGKLTQSSGAFTDALQKIGGAAHHDIGSKFPSLVERFTQSSIAYIASDKQLDFNEAIAAGEEVDAAIAAAGDYFKSLPRKERTVIRYVRRDADVIRQSLRQRNAVSVGLNDAMNELVVATRAINTLTDTIRHHTRSSQTDALSQMNGNVSDTISSSFTGLAIGGILAIILAYIIGVSIAKPLARITQSVAQLASGDKDVIIPYSARRDEIGKLASAANVFKDKAFELEMLAQEKLKAELEAAEALRHRDAEQAAIIEQKRNEEIANRAARREIRRRQRLAMADEFEQRVSGIVQAVMSAAKEVGQASRSLVANTEQTQFQVKNTYSTTTEATSSVSAVAESTEELAVSFESVSDELSVSATVAGDAAKEAVKTTETVASLNQAALQIGEIVKLINDIAEQTNLLALNATIEAARAGDAGRGFAVVASEVKNLAAQSSKATAQIAGYVDKIQNVSSDAGKAISNISAIITKMNSVTQSVVAAVNQQSSATQDIAANIQQLASGTEIMRESVGIMGGAAEETQTMAVGLKGYADSLMTEAEALGSQLGRFLDEIRSDREDSTQEEDGLIKYENVIRLKTA